MTKADLISALESYGDDTVVVLMGCPNGNVPEDFDECVAPHFHVVPGSHWSSPIRQDPSRTDQFRGKLRGTVVLAPCYYYNVRAFSESDHDEHG